MGPDWPQLRPLSTERESTALGTGLPTDGSLGGLTEVPNTAIEASQTHITGDIFGQRDFDKAAAIAQAKIPMVLTPLDRVNLAKGGEKRTDSIVWDLERTPDGTKCRHWSGKADGRRNGYHAGWWPDR